MPSLPIHEVRPAVERALRAGDCCVLSAPTGSGKSTQVPQFAADDASLRGQVLVLEPRRLAARMLARRVAEERGCDLGGEVGFQTRYESHVSRATRIRFITEGILPRLLLSDPHLGDIGTVIFDEFHERSLASDLSLALVQHLRRRRPDLRLVVMSATLETGALAAYLAPAQVVRAAVRQHAVDIRYARPPPRATPWDAAAAAVGQLLRETPSGDLLVFQPGAYEIRRTLEACARVTAGGPVQLLPLYGDLPAEQQRRVMQPGPGRRVVVATNIAETSLTIPGVRHVVDTGLARVHRYDGARGVSTLYVEGISRAEADQRAGRAGREGPGVCVRLWSPLEHSGRAAAREPEVRRVDLAEATLQVRLLGFARAADFPWFEPPAPVALAAAEALLADLGALAGDGGVTDLGRRLAELPVHPRLARLLIEAAARGCLTDAAWLAALLGERLPAMASRSPDTGPDQLETDFRGPLAWLDGARHSRTGLLPEAGDALQQLLRTHAFFLQSCRRRGLAVRTRAGDRHAALAQCLLLAYPDRLARRRAPGTPLCDLRNGRRGEISRDSVVQEAQLLVAAEVRETGGRGQAPRTVLSLCSAVREEWLHDLFPPTAWSHDDELVWNDEQQQVEQARRRFCLGVLLEEKRGPPADRVRAAALLADKILERQLPLAGLNAEAEAWLARVRWTAERFPERGLIRFEPDDLAVAIHELCAGESRYARVQDKPLLPLLRGMLSADDSRFVNGMAPEQFMLPNGRRMRLEYRPGQPPHGRARIQDLYDLRATPRVGGGRVPVLLEILAPNQRPVQITDDLAGFWDKHYPAVKRALARRYPKHQWR